MADAEASLQRRPTEHRWPTIDRRAATWGDAAQSRCPCEMSSAGAEQVLICYTDRHMMTKHFSEVAVNSNLGDLRHTSIPFIRLTQPMRAGADGATNHAIGISGMQILTEWGTQSFLPQTERVGDRHVSRLAQTAPALTPLRAVKSALAALWMRGSLAARA